ncbi:hypothetical protein [Nocardiopsis dassonvillei]|uniref:hypothetical protein n=1 Tax=Nocardiopsis dassonvillei TaxID=2014 RepID=UPI00362EE988
MDQSTQPPTEQPSAGELYVVQVIATGILIAALAVSYMHLVELFQSFGEVGWRSYAIAATVDSLIVLGVLGGRTARARGTDPGTVVRVVLSAGIAATIVGNIHHGVRANVPEDVFEHGLLDPQVDALGVATVAMGVIVSLWAPLAAELAYRGLLWAQDQLRALRAAQAARAAATADETAPAAPAAPQERTEPEPDPEPTPERDEDPELEDDRRPGPDPEPAEDNVVALYRRRRARGEQVSERRLMALVETELGFTITRHQAKKAIAQAKLASGAHRRPDSARQTELAAV